uniref:Uncharacterized protein n=1 Tax=Aplanochytrium stocchinoi TaxID=215587 RepID=A0A7S3PI43_9STRA
MKKLIYSCAALALSLCTSSAKLTMLERKEDFWQGKLYVERSSIRNEPQSCVAGKVTLDGEEFPCDGVDFLSFISNQELNISNRDGTVDAPGDVPYTTQASDIWGWLSPTGKEFTIECLDNGVVIVDSTDPVDPCVVAKIPATRSKAAWCDVKVYKNVLYIVKDAGRAAREIEQNATKDIYNTAKQGIEVVDLLQFDTLGCPNQPETITPNFIYAGHGRSHNLVINTETGFLYSVGTDTCNSGLHMIALEPNPLEPTFAGCAGNDGYTHDAQCVLYDGPDEAFQGSEICFAFNEDTVTIWDVSDKSSPVILSRTLYENQIYTHQGWVTSDWKTLLVDDELDELCAEEGSSAYSSLCADLSLDFEPFTGHEKTRTHIFDISELRWPRYTGYYEHTDVSIDHNLYVWGQVHAKGQGGNPPMKNPPSSKYAYLNNYIAGLRILDISAGADNPGGFKETGYFDIAPDLSSLEFLGAWSGYMHPSGVYAISSIDRGLFFLQPENVFDTAGSTSDSNTDSGAVWGVAFAIIAVSAVGAFGAAIFLSSKQKAAKHYVSNDATL